MDVSLTFIRSSFLILSLLLSIFYAAANAESGFLSIDTLLGALFGGIFAIGMIAFDRVLKNFNLRTFNIAILGIFFGYLMSQAVFSIISQIIDFNLLPYGMIIKSFICLSMVYISMILTAQSASKLYISLPFFKFNSQMLKKSEILLDESILLDPRFIDLAASGLLDHRLLIPRFIVNQMKFEIENEDECERNVSRKIFDAIKKLEGLRNLELRFSDTDFPEIKNCTEKLIKLAKILDAYIFIGDTENFQQYQNDNIKIIKFNQLCNSLKPLSQCGENINIKIQRIGKEARQGIGYLEDGTMVVVNGGAKFIEQTIKAQVLSVKRTTSGRIMIFCNALDGSFEPEQMDSSFTLSASPYAINSEEDFLEPIPNKYFTI